MNAKLLLFLAAILTIVCAWLPWASVMGININGFRGDSGGNVGIFFVVLGALIGVMAFLGKKWSMIIAILLSLCVVGLGIKYYMDLHVEGMSVVGYGIYVMIAGGVLGLIGGLMGMRGSSSAPAA